MKIGSLFSGIGGLELGLQIALSATVEWQVETAAYPRAVLAKHYPNTKRFTDVQVVHRHYAHPCGTAFTAGALSSVDLVCGGFPCQDISTAGKRAGLAGARSGLWWQFWRILREIRPRFAVLENVAALTNRGLSTVLGSLAAIGYDTEWSVLSAADVGAPHLRRRVFIIAELGHSNRIPGRLKSGRRSWPGGENPVDPGGDGLPWTLAHAQVYGRETERQPFGTEAPHPRAGSTGKPHRGRGAAPVPGVGGTADGLPGWIYRGTDPEAWETVARTVAARSVPHRTARLKALGNAVVPQCSYEVGLRVLEKMR